jgi:hypothetical protein
MLSYSEIGLAATAIGSSVYLYHRGQGTKKRLPPSPPGSYPFIGHALVLPNEQEHLVYNKWSKELNSKHVPVSIYLSLLSTSIGDIISLTAAGQTIIVLDSVEAANELLDRRSKIYSDRPQLRVIADPDL